MNTQSVRSLSSLSSLSLVSSAPEGCTMVVDTASGEPIAIPTLVLPEPSGKRGRQTVSIDCAEQAFSFLAALTSLPENIGFTADSEAGTATISVMDLTPQGRPRSRVLVSCGMSAFLDFCKILQKVGPAFSQIPGRSLVVQPKGEAEKPETKGQCSNG
jgi:hypothetical protein